MTSELASEARPLTGKRIVVTRAKAQAGALSDKLRKLGADVVEMPAIEIQPAADYAPLDHAISHLETYDWLIFTSANGVRFFMERLRHAGRDLAGLRARICAIGPATRAELEALHLKVDLMGEEYVAEGLLAAFAPFELSGKRMLLPRAAVARDLVPEGLAARGAHVDAVEAYRTGVPKDAAALAGQIFGAGSKPDVVTFTSASTVQHLFNIVGAGALAGVRVASIGPITSQKARELGIEVATEARVSTIDGLIEAILLMCQTEAPASSPAGAPGPPTNA